MIYTFKIDTHPNFSCCIYITPEFSVAGKNNNLKRSAILPAGEYILPNRRISLRNRQFVRYFCSPFLVLSNRSFGNLGGENVEACRSRVR